MELKPFLFLPGASATAATGLGGKAENLWRLAQCRVDVPRWIALDAACLAQVTAGAPDAAAAIRTFAFPPEWPATLNEALDQAGITAAFLAVRSSAAGEDGDQHSFAGQLDSCLFVRRDRLTEAIRQVWLSAFGERAAAYRRQNRLTDQPIRVAVIIQEMVEADVSGVAFDVDLATGSRRGTTISAVYGLGEGLVSGLLNADTFYCHDGVVSRREIAVKNQAVVFASAQTGGTKLADVPADLRQLPAVDDETVKRIAATVRQLSAAFGRPQDVEWALKDGSLKILQTRPITTLDRLADGDGLELLWDNSNIVESYPGVTTPLTFSFIRKVYREVYRQFCLMMGVEPALLEANADAFEMLGLIRGRVYYNLYNWYKVLMMLPGYSINAGFMEQMMGVKEPLSRRPVIVESKRWKYRRLAALVTGNLINFLRLDAKVKHFQRNFDAAVAPFENNSPAGRSPHELAAIFNDLEKRLLDSWQPPLINDFFAMIFYGILKKLLVKWDIDQRGTLQNDLLSGAGDIISTEPVRRLQHLTELLAATPELRNCLLAAPPAEFLRRLPDFPAPHTEFEAYVKKFGKRCIGELKLETVTYQDDPTQLVELLRSYVKCGKTGHRFAGDRERQLCRAAETLAAERLRRHPLRRLLFGYVLKNTRKLVRNRENLRFERTRLFAVVRDIFLAFGSHFQREGILADRRDIFYLTKEEIFDFLNGTATSTDLPALVALRKREFDRYRQSAPDERFTTSGIVYHGNTFRQTGTTPTTQRAQAGTLAGIGCCGGVVRAPVKIVRNPTLAVDLDGFILAAERTDPGWAPLFPVCRGVLVERGSILSHAAIVTRELGIPSIVGIPDLLASLQDGEMIEMDGAAGVIRRLGSEVQP